MSVGVPCPAPSWKIVSVKRVRFTDGDTNWFADAAQSPYAIRDFLEFKTTWHPIGA